MKTPTFKTAILGFCLALPSMLLAAPQLATVKSIGVRGDVTLTNEQTGEVTRLKDGATFSEGYTVTTRSKSSATIVLSTGAYVAVAPNTTFSISTFEQEEFDAAKGVFEELSADPSKSDVRLDLKRGRLVGNVEKLTPESNFQIDTVLGTVTITGTTWDIEIESVTYDNASGTYGTVLEVSNLNGGVHYNMGAIFASVQAGDKMQIRFNGEDDFDNPGTPLDPDALQIVTNGINDSDARAIVELLLQEVKFLDSPTGIIPSNSGITNSDITVISRDLPDFPEIP